jgi:hypothetical protein
MPTAWLLISETARIISRTGLVRALNIEFIEPAAFLTSLVSDESTPYIGENRLARSPVKLALTLEKMPEIVSPALLKADPIDELALDPDPSVVKPNVLDPTPNVFPRSEIPALNPDPMPVMPAAI